ncbi:kinase-like domain-containing protein [Rhizophagus irregularis DAOM 181602=DAOM 197198]|nr:kinase-like domain-containing protein [Rhizophagus irregularis DAOM 181602=DAOM 197198]
MEQPVSYKHKTDILISDNTPSTQPTRKSQNIYKKCNECNIKRKIFDKSHEICHVCYNIKKILKPKQSGNKVIDDFIRYTQRGFSKIYKATWVDGPINNWDEIKNNHWNITRRKNYTVVLKKLNNSKNIASKELNELKVFYQIFSNKNASKSFISNYFGITQDPITKDIMIIMPYYNSGDLGISKSATECTDNSNENYGRRPFWDRNHDTELIIDIYDGLRPPIATNAPEEYIELMKECWHSDPNKRPTAVDIRIIFNSMFSKEYYGKTKVIKSSDIGPVTINNLGAVYKSRPLSQMIQSAMSLRRSRSQSIDPFYYYQKNSKASADKRKVDKGFVEDSNINDQSIKRRKLFENENHDYFTKEIELDINANMNQQQHNEIEYVTKEFDIDINNIDESNL